MNPGARRTVSVITLYHGAGHVDEAEHEAIDALARTAAAANPVEVEAHAGRISWTFAQPLPECMPLIAEMSAAARPWWSISLAARAAT